MSTERLRAVVVGGHIGRSHAHGYIESDRTDLVAVCDLDPMTLDAFGDEFDVEQRYSDYETMLREERPDIVSIGTPQQAHAAMTTLAATRYQPRAIICEKPLASSTGEGYAMLAACRANNVKLAIGHQGRFLSLHERVRELLAEGAIGRVLTVHAGPQKPDAGLMNIGTHNLNYLHYMLGDPTPQWVLANVQRTTDRYERSWPAEDLAGAIIEFDGGIRLCLESDLPPAGMERNVRTFVGTEGMILLDGSFAGNHDIKLLRSGASGWETVAYGESNDFAQARARELDALAAWASGDADEHRGDANLAIHTLEILMGIYESARTHTLVHLPIATQCSPLQQMLTDGDLSVEHPGRYDIRHIAATPE